MHEGYPCRDKYPNEHFEEGITNGAKWYNVPGKTLFFPLQTSQLLETEPVSFNVDYSQLRSW